MRRRSNLIALVLVSFGYVTVAEAQNYNNEAQQFCDQYFSSAYTPTDGFNWSNGAYEVADVRVEVRSNDLSNADSLNGTAWKGFVFYRGVAIRQVGAAWRDHSDPVFQCSLQFSADGAWHGTASDSNGMKYWTF